MKAVVVSFFFLLLSAPVFGQVAPYWIPDENCVVGHDGGYEPYTKRRLGSGLILRVDWGYRWEDARYVLDDEGDLCMTESSSFDPAASLSETGYSYATPVKILDYPLTAGKTWYSETTRTAWTGIVTVPRFYSKSTTVVGPRVVDTVLGPLDVIEISCTTQVFNSSPFTTVYLLHDQIGDVTNMVSFSNCDTVADKKASWGNIKSMYR
jgi:hypothetical protein